MKKLLLLIGILLVLIGCGRRISESVVSTKDSVAVIQHQDNHVYVEKIKQQVIDSMQKIKLPVEHSTSVAPVKTQRSHLYTSLAISDAYVDSVGMLHHSLYNKDTALLPVKQMINNTTIAKRDSTSHQSSVDNHQKTVDKTVIVKQKWMENFFYYSGMILYILIIIYIVFKCYSNGIFGWIKDFFKKQIK